MAEDPDWPEDLVWTLSMVWRGKSLTAKLVHNYTISGYPFLEWDDGDAWWRQEHWIAMGNVLGQPAKRIADPGAW